MVFVCQIFAKYLVCAIDFHLDSPISLPISYYRVVLTYNCKAQCKREVCKQYARKARDTAIMPVFSTNCHQAPGRAVATGREVCVRGREWESTPFVFSSFTSLIDSFKQAFRHDWITAFVRTFYYNVTAISSPRCVRSSRQRTSQTRRPPALSYRDERHENSTRYTKET